MVAEPVVLPLTEQKIINEFANLRNAISVIQAEFNEKLMKQGNALGSNLEMVKQLNGKVDAIKVQADMNDSYVKTQVDAKAAEIMEKITVLSQAGHTTWNEIEVVKQKLGNHDEQLQNIHNQMAEVSVRMKDLQAQTVYGNTGPTQNQFSANGPTVKNIMEYRSISMMDKLTNDTKEFNIWALRLKNTLKQINPIYGTLMELIERLPTNVVTYENWSENYAKALREHSQTEEIMFNRMSSDLYTVLVDKCTNTHVNMFENDELDGFYAYNQLFRSVTRTAGLGSLERREYLTNPQIAKKESEVYDLIMAWEKELKDQEKTTPPEFRPLLSPIMKMSVMKKIAFGNIKEHIRTNEAIKTYDELRTEVLTMALFNKTENNKQTQAPAAMDLNAMMNKIRESINNSYQPELNQNYKAPETNYGAQLNNLGGERSKDVTVIDEMIGEIMAMVKGKGKGRETRSCFICGKSGHLAKDCYYNPKGKGKGKGDLGKGDYGKGKGKGDLGGKGGKGGPKGGCWTCGGNHYESDCPVKKRGVNGVEEEGCQHEHSQENQEGFNLGGGEETQDAWNKIYPNYNLEYERSPKLKTTISEKCIYNIGKDGEWHKVTFTGDSGAVDHVMKKNEATWIPLKPTAMSKAGIGFTAANGTKMPNYGGRMLTGETEKKEGVRMNVQVTDTQKNLASFPKMVEEGNDIILSKKKGCYITNEKTGMRIPMRLKPGGTPEFDIWIKKAKVNGRFGVLNMDGEADIKDEDDLSQSGNGKSAFQRLEEWI